VSQFDPLRADDVAMDYYRLGSNAPLVFFLLSFGNFGTELPLVQLGAPAGSTGVACVDLGGFINAGLAIGSVDEAFRVTSFPAASRASLVGFQLVQQAVEFDVNAGVLHSSPCGRQTF
jgi:hypothetical protein